MFSCAWLALRALAGLASFDSTAWFGIVGPAGLTPEVMGPTQGHETGMYFKSR